MARVKRGSIQKRFVALLALVAAFIVVVFTVSYLTFSLNSLEEELTSQMNDISELATTSLTSALWQYNYEYINDFVDSLFLYKDIVYVGVLSGDKAIKARSRDKTKTRSFQFFKNSDTYITRENTVIYNNFNIGTIRLVLTRKHARNRIFRDSAVNLALVILLVGAVAITVVITSRKYIFLPLLELENSARKIGSGKFDTPINVSSNDEIGQLAHSFRKMIEDIKTITASRDELDREVQRRLKAESKLVEERDRAQTYLDISGVMMLAIDSDKKVRLINTKGCSLLGYDESEVVGKNWFDHFVPAKNRDRIEEVFFRVINGEVTHTEYAENQVLCKDGGKKLIAWHHTVLKDKKGRVTGTLSSGEDITERKRAETDLISSLEEKNVLLREIHHRVKNNLQMIQSLLSLQSVHINRDDPEQVFQDSINRINSIALVHETLYRSENLNKLDIKAYFEELIGYISHIYANIAATVTVDFDIKPLNIDLDTCISCGLIVNELVVNALKHAFQGKNNGILTISLHRKGNREAILTVEDDGSGLPENIEIENAETLGFKLVKMLAEDQLNGQLTVSQEKGLRVCVSFPVQNQDN